MLMSVMHKSASKGSNLKNPKNYCFFFDILYHIYIYLEMSTKSAKALAVQILLEPLQFVLLSFKAQVLVNYSI
jgi:hypothetical protein